ncbi:MAG: Hsp20/alpha crystallin family protein [Oligoflexia bacterium]|nr:Hsp20/alpha crystallin family protein [Oligoflexia bacterium]
MNLRPYNKTPWGLLFDLDKEFDSWWPVPGDKNKHSFPACDFHEDKDNYFISLDLPGLKRENIKISYENQTLTISGAREEEYTKELKENSSRFTEKFYGSFSRSFNLPSLIEEDKIEAHFSNGVLELALPKTSKSKGKEIPVKEGRESSLFSKLTKKAS